MTLAVLGKESLSQLQSTVDAMFAAVPNRGAGARPSERWLGKVKPFLNNQPLQAYNIVPVQVFCLSTGREGEGKLGCVFWGGGYYV